MPQVPVKRRKVLVPPKVQTSSGMPWEAAVEAFLADKKREGCSPATLTIYRDRLLGSRIATFREDAGIHDVVSFDANALTRFDTELQEAGTGAATRSQSIRVLRTFTRWCASRGWDTSDISSVNTPRSPIKEPPIISPTQEAQLVAAARSKRDEFIIRFLIRTGLRRGEALALTVDSIIETATGTYLKVVEGKGAKDRLVPLDTRLDPNFSKEVKRYIKLTRPADTGDQRALFLSLRKNPENGYDALTAEGLKTVFARLSEAVGFNVHAHMCRYTYASRMIGVGLSPLVVKRALGHTTMQMLDRYVAFDAESLMLAVR
jgi:site-specific recombinase XerD